MNSPRLVISAPHGRSGKTTVTVGLVAALAARGLAVQPFKKGPDYIDPSWLSGAAGRPCRNLDLFMMGEEGVLAAFQRGMSGAGVAVIEGAMGLYDGLDVEGTGSTAALSRLLRCPVVLVVDATRMTRSVAALVHGYQQFESGVEVAGAILNNVARARHEEILVESIRRYCGIPVLGCLPKLKELAIPDRHLGLVPKAESEGPVEAIEAARQAAVRYLDLDGILAIARGAPALQAAGGDTRSPGLACTIGVMLDRVFTFYYPENLEELEMTGARLVYVDSLADPVLPEVDALYVGGGFPEVFMRGLEANSSLRADVKRRIEAGMPVYAECAGLIYLARRVTWGDRSAEMVGALPCDVEMTERPQGHGYVVAEVRGDNPFFTVGRQLRGHEFHNTRVTGLEYSKSRFAYRLTRGAGIDGEHNDGLVVGNVLAGYAHLHALGAPGWAEGLVEAAATRGVLVGS